MSAIATAALAAALLIAIAILPGGGPPKAQASPGLTTGFGSRNYQSSDPATRSQWFDRTVDAGAGIVTLDVPWNAIAPQRPDDPANPGSSAYDFSGIDAAVRDAASRGLAVSLLVGGTADWAQSPGRTPNVSALAWNPNLSDFADFMRAVAARYSGNFTPEGAPRLPAVEAVEIWNEPNASGALSPQYQGKTDVAAPIYRNMLNAAYDAVKSVAPKMLVVTGGTDPYGAPPNAFPDMQLVPPVTFWQDVLCVQPVQAKKRKGKKPAPTRYVRTGGCNGPVKFDVLAHHPIDNTGSGPLAHGPRSTDASTPDLGRIVSVLRGAERAGTTLPGKHRVWVTEFWWDSNPPNPSGAKLGTQARWIEQSLYFFWKAGADTAINLAIGDTELRPNVRAGFQSGAYFQDGRPKPALTAFRFPFVTDRIEKRQLRAWGRSPSAGELSIQRRTGGRWLPVKTIRVGKGAVFTAKLQLQGHQKLRAQVGGTRSLVWKQG